MCRMHKYLNHRNNYFKFHIELYLLLRMSELRCELLFIGNLVRYLYLSTFHCLNRSERTILCKWKYDFKWNGWCKAMESCCLRCLFHWVKISDFGHVLSIRVSVNISHLSILVRQASDGSVDPKLYILDVERDVVRYFNFASGRNETDDSLAPPNSGKHDYNKYKKRINIRKICNYNNIYLYLPNSPIPPAVRFTKYTILCLLIEVRHRA